MTASATMLDRLRKGARWTISLCCVAGGLNLALPLGGGTALRLVDLSACGAIMLLFAAFVTGWRPALPQAVSITRVVLCSLCIVLAIGSYTSAFPIRDAAFAFRLSYLVFVPLCVEFSSVSFSWLLNWILIGGLLQATLVLIELASFLVLGPEGALGLDLVLKTAHLRDSESVLWWVGSIIRPTGSYNHPNGAGAFLAVTCAVALVLLRNTTSQRSKLAYGFSLALLSLAVFATGSRGALVIAGLPVLGTMVQLQSPRWRAAMVGAATVLLVLIIAANSPRSATLETQGTGLQRTLSRATSVLQVDRLATVAARFDTWRAGLQLVTENPAGIGLSRTQSALRSSQQVGASHNSFVLVTASLGIVPAVLVTLVLFVAFTRALAWSGELGTSTVLLLAACILSFMLEDRIQEPTALVSCGLLLTDVSRYKWTI